MGFHRFIRRALEGEPITVFNDGEQTRDSSFVDDIVTANVLAGTSDAIGEVFNIGGGSRVSVNRVLAVIEALVERPIQITRIAEQKGDVRHTSADIRRARRTLGYQPTVDVERGLAAEVAWLSEALTGTDRQPVVSGIASLV